MLKITSPRCRPALYAGELRVTWESRTPTSSDDRYPDRRSVPTPADFYREAQRAVETTGKVRLTLLNQRRQVTLSAS